MITINLDFAYNVELHDFLSGIEKHRGTITKFVATGPGGGNSCVDLTFPDEATARAYLVDSYYDATDPDLYQGDIDYHIKWAVFS